MLRDFHYLSDRGETQPRKCGVARLEGEVRGWHGGVHAAEVRAWPTARKRSMRSCCTVLAASRSVVAGGEAVEQLEGDAGLEERGGVRQRLESVIRGGDIVLPVALLERGRWLRRPR